MIIRRLYEIICETFENYKTLQNLNGLSFIKKIQRLSHILLELEEILILLMKKLKSREVKYSGHHHMAS